MVNNKSRSRIKSLRGTQNKENQSPKIIVAIDGPAGAGKSTVAKLVAKKLGFFYIDTGALYRALTLKAKRRKLNLNDEKLIIGLLKNTRIELAYKNNKLKVSLDKEDITQEIRKPYISYGVSDVAKIKGVRQIMTEIQRNLAQGNNCVLEGRDIGTIIFPNAKYKFYLDADFKERVLRRFKELKENNENIDLQAVEKDLATRDNIDSTRKIAPLKKAKDAIRVDTTNLSINEVVDKITSWIKP
ncbi:MAG: (d)CMP kinase [Candidatus Omnitrophica bacterium]|nr:(d)CMP kinase [Candidatus Omnitrophota bacterium]MDD5354994.1 (d)CMP kinase [Candidatus Omnitrophota bacterium]